MLDIIYQLLALVGLSTIVLSFIFSIVFLILRQQIHLSIKIGNPRLTRYQRHVAINRDAIMEKVVWYRERGKTWKFIADYLNEKGLKTQQGNTWKELITFMHSLRLMKETRQIIKGMRKKQKPVKFKVDYQTYCP